MGNILTSIELVRSRDNRALLDSHRYNWQWWSPRNTLAQRCVDFVAGRQWSAAEQDAASKKNKTLRTFNILKPAERTLLGNYLLGKWDVKWTPDGGKKIDELVAALEALRIRDSRMQGDAHLDPEIYLICWATGLGYQMVDMLYSPGTLPTMKTWNLNRFAVYFDPNSREPILRRDAKFVDAVSWYSVNDLVKSFPSKKDWILEKAASRGTNGTQGEGGVGYQDFTVSTDRGHESMMYRNGLFRVIERFYRVDRDELSPEELGPSLSPVTGRPYCATGVKHVEELWYSVVVEDFGNEYLFNGRYHCQPVNPFDGTVMFPILENSWESINGENHGAVEYELDPSQAYNAILTNLLHVMKHQSSSALLQDRAAFKDEKEADLAAKYHSDADRTFAVKPNRTKDAFGAIERNSNSRDMYEGLNAMKANFDEIGSVSPALQGNREGSESGVLYSQRVEQATVQLTRSSANYRTFLEQKYMLRYIYQRQYYSWEMEIQILEPSDSQRKNNVQSITVNQAVPAKDQYGFEIPGKIDYLNDIDGALYHLSVMESARTPTHRMKTMGQLAEISQSPLLASDPASAAIILKAQIEVSDLDPKYKDELDARREQLAQNEQVNNQALQAEAQAAQAKGQAATTMSQAMAGQSQAMAQATMAKIGIDQQMVQIKQQDSQVKAGATMQKSQSDHMKMGLEMKKLQSEDNRMAIEDQKMQMDAQTGAASSAMDLKRKEMELQKMAMELKAKEMELAIREMDMHIKATEAGSAKIEAHASAHEAANRLAVGPEQKDGK